MPFKDPQDPINQYIMNENVELFSKLSKKKGFTTWTFRSKTDLATDAIYFGIMIAGVIISCNPLILTAALLTFLQIFLFCHNAHIDDRLIDAMKKKETWAEGGEKGIYHDLPQPKSKKEENWYNILTFRKKTYIATFTLYTAIAFTGLIMSCMPLAVCGALLLVYNLFLGWNNAHIDDRLLDAYKKEGETWGICHELPPGAKAFKKFFDSVSLAPLYIDEQGVQRFSLIQI